jgi:hypothetical protein
MKIIDRSLGFSLGYQMFGLLKVVVSLITK